MLSQISVGQDFGVVLLYPDVAGFWVDVEVQKHPMYKTLVCPADTDQHEMIVLSIHYGVIPASRTERGVFFAGKPFHIGREDILPFLNF